MLQSASACCSRSLAIAGLRRPSFLHLSCRTAFAMRYKPKGGWGVPLLCRVGGTGGWSWCRKPPSLPPAKTKRYTVPAEEWMEPEHVRELLWRRQAYNTALASIRALFKQELAESGGRLGIDEDIQGLLEEDSRQFDALLDDNAKENERLALLRSDFELLQLLLHRASAAGRNGRRRTRRS